MSRHRETTLRLDGRTLALSNLDKVFFPDAGLTKGDLVDYYRRIAEVALPHWRERPLSMHRFPDGIDGKDFFQKAVPDHFPDWIGRVELAKEDGRITHVVARDAATLVYLADQGCITPHLGLSRVDRIEAPDRLVFDLDPSDEDFAKVQRTAGALRALLDELALAAFVQASGSRGLHVVVPLDRSAGFEAVRDFARDCGRRLAARHPDEITVAQRKAERGRRVFVDYLRNAYGQTAVAPYAVRARPGAPVATPLDWSEALDRDLTPRRYTIRNLFRRLAQKPDPWRDIAHKGQSLTAAARRLAALRER